MILFIIFNILCINQAEAAKVIYLHNGIQEMQDLKHGGAVKGEIIWDERVHGPLPVLPADPEAVEAYEEDEPVLEGGRPVLKQAEDAFGEPLVDLDGNPVMVQVMKKVRKLRENAEKNTAHAAKVKAQKEAKAQGVLGDYKWAGSLSIYDKTYTSADPSITNGTYAGLSQLPWTEADKSPGLAAYLKYIGGVDKADALGANGFMAGIAFKETVDAIVAAKGPNAITRSAVADALKTTKSDFMGWIGQPKGGKDVMPCFMVVQIQDGKWNRVYPTATGELDCAADNRIVVKLDTAAEAAKIP